MQRLFSMFPEGWPGFGLLFLRSSVAITLLAEACCQRQPLGWTSWAAILVSIPLFAGYMTPIAAVIGLLLHGMICSRYGGGSETFVITISLDIAAQALLGPGAYSVDALRFGRCVLVLPPSNERAELLVRPTSRPEWSKTSYAGCNFSILNPAALLEDLDNVHTTRAVVNALN